MQTSLGAGVTSRHGPAKTTLLFDSEVLGQSSAQCPLRVLRLLCSESLPVHVHAAVFQVPPVSALACLYDPRGDSGFSGCEDVGLRFSWRTLFGEESHVDHVDF